MMFSSIEEAWNQPKYTKPIIESFNSASECDCDKIIEQLKSCPGCLSAVQKLLGREHNFFEKAILEFKKKSSKDKVVLFLLSLAFLIIVKLLISI